MGTVRTVPDDDEVSRLTRELWVARDAVIGATAELGTARSRVTELEGLVHQLRIELAYRDRERELGTRLMRLAARPVRYARRVTGRSQTVT